MYFPLQKLYSLCKKFFATLNGHYVSERLFSFLLMYSIRECVWCVYTVHILTLLYCGITGQWAAILGGASMLDFCGWQQELLTFYCIHVFLCVSIVYIWADIMVLIKLVVSVAKDIKEIAARNRGRL